MKNWTRFQNCGKHNPLRFIGGIRGTIALFLCVILTPFLTLIFVLVEAGRYNSAVSVLDEAMGTSAVSTLANYDSYLQSRFGLLAISQGTDLSSVYSSSLDTNSSVMGSSLSIDSLSVEGLYALSDSDIIYEQILEYCKLNAPTTLAVDLADLTEWIKKLESIGNSGSIFNIITKGTDAVDSAITLAESVEDLQDLADDLDDLKSTYESDYKSFKSAVNSLISKLSEERPDEEEDKSGAKKYDSDVSSLRTKAEKARKTYAETLQKIIDKLTEYKTAMSDLSSSMNSILNDVASLTTAIATLEEKLSQQEKDLKELNQEMKDMLDETSDKYLGSDGKNSEEYQAALEKQNELETAIAEAQSELDVYNAEVAGTTGMSNSLNEALSDYSDATLGEVITAFGNLKTKVSSYSVSSVTKDSSQITDANYYYIAIKGYVSSDDLQAYLDEQEDELVSGSLGSIVKGLTSAFEAIFDVQVFFDVSLMAEIDEDFYDDLIGGLPGGSAAGGGVISVVSAIGELITDTKNFVDEIKSLKLVKALKKLKELLEDVQDVCDSITQFLEDIVNNIKDLFSSYERLYYSTYSTYMFTCRTNYTSFKTMTGTSVKQSASLNPDIGGYGGLLFTGLSSLVSCVRGINNGTTEDSYTYTFSGAELEYILYGSTSEVSNQVYTFLALYLLKLAMDIIPVAANAEVRALATAATIGFPVVMALYIFLEPFVETVLLVNGADIAAFPSTLYLTPSGIPTLLTKLVSVLHFTTEQKNNIEASMNKAISGLSDYSYTGTSSSSSAFSSLGEFDYRQYCLVLMLLTVTQDQQIARIQNMIQMETYYYYNNKGVSYQFDLNKSYTYLHADATVKVSQILPSLTNSTLFTVNRSVYRGY